MDDREVNALELRERALAELRKRHDLGAHVLAYLMVNSFLAAIWWVTGAGFFWPVFPVVRLGDRADLPRLGRVLADAGREQDPGRDGRIAHR